MRVPLVLASASPRRREILTRMGLPFRVLPTDVHERTPASMSPGEAARHLAWRKAETARRHVRRGFIIGGDTVVSLGLRRFGKPRSRADARRILRRLSGRTHEVTTGLAVIDARTGIGVLGSETSRVTFKRLSPAVIAAYVATGEPRDKAGGYGIQGGARNFVRKVRGDYSNIVGLPIHLLRALLARFGLRMRR